MGIGEKMKKIQDLYSLDGRSMKEVLGELGLPFDIWSYKVQQRKNMDWNMGLLKGAYPPDQPGNGEINILEAVWIDGNYLIRACFHLVDDDWVVLGAMRVYDGVRF